MLDDLILQMFDVEMIKFGDFTLKSGKKSPVYIDVRSAISYPRLFTMICDLLYLQLKNLNYDLICGVPYSALTFASAISYQHKLPMLLKRKEQKEYGTKKILEGSYKAGDKCVIIEDVVTTGQSICETINVLKDHAIIVQDVASLIDRQQGGEANLQQEGYKLHSIINLTEVVDILAKHNKITPSQKQTILSVI